MHFRALSVIAAAIMWSSCDSSVVSDRNGPPWRGSTRDLCPAVSQLDSDEFALRWRDDPAWSDSLAAMTLYPNGVFRSEFRIQHLTTLPSGGSTTCYSVFPLTFLNENDRRESFSDVSIWVRADHPVQNRDRRPLPFESGWYTYEIDLERFRSLQFRSGLRLDSSHASNTWMRLTNATPGVIRDIDTYLRGPVHIDSMQPGETTEYFDVGRTYGTPSETSVVFGADTVRFMVTDRVGETPEPHGYYTYPIDTVGFWRYRERGSLRLDRTAEQPE